MFLTNDYADKSISLCDNSSRWELSKAHPNYDAMASALIATFMTGKQVLLMLEPNQAPSCSPEIDRFKIR